MASPEEIQEFLDKWGLPDPGIFGRQRISQLLDSGVSEAEILGQVGGSREAIGQAQATEEIGGRGFFDPRGAQPLVAPTKGFGGKDVPQEQSEGLQFFSNTVGSLLEQGFSEFARQRDQFVQEREDEEALTPFDRAVLALQAQFPDALITEAPDGRIQVSSGGDVLFFDALESGEPLLVQKGLDRAQPGAGGTRLANRQFQGIDPRSGRAIIFDPNTGVPSLGPVVGFADIDPERSFALDTAEQQRRGAETTRDITSRGRNFLAAAFLANQGKLPLGIPAANINQADLLNSLGAGTTGPTAGFAPAPGAGTTPAAEAAQSGVNVPAPAPVGNAGPGLVEPITQQGLADLGAETLEGTRVGSVLRGEPVGEDQRFRGFAVPTPASLDALGEEELGALDTQLQNDPSLMLTLDELRQQQRRGFSAPARRARGTVRQV
jgi:hypothetical protein